MRAEFHGHEASAGIYVIRNLATGRFYLGQAAKFSRRFQRHVSELASGRHHNASIQRDYSLGGEWLFEVIAVVSDPTERSKVELRAIKSGWGELYNESLTMPNQAGRKRSEETRRRISEVQIGRPRSPAAVAATAAANKGRKHTAEARANMSAAQKGIPRTPEWLANMSAAQKGKIIPPEARANMAAARRGKPWSPIRVANAKARAEARERAEYERLRAKYGGS